MEPASTIIQSFGGEAEIAKLLGIALPTPYNWTKPKTSGGTAGVIPQRHHRLLLGAAKERGLAISLEDFLPRSEVAK